LPSLGERIARGLAVRRLPNDSEVSAVVYVARSGTWRLPRLVEP